MKTIIYVWLALLFFSCRDKAVVIETKAEDHSAHGAMVSAAGYSDSVNAGLISPDTMKGSPERTAMNSIGKTHVHIEYCSPGVKDRVIWGGLVAFDKVWVTGAHHATTIRFYDNVVIGTTNIRKGTYAVFTIPGKGEWTFILNTRTEQHLADDYQPAEDVLRIQIKPEAHPFTARLTYTVNATDASHGNIEMAWDKLVIRIPFIVNTPAHV